MRHRSALAITLVATVLLLGTAGCSSRAKPEAAKQAAPQLVDSSSRSADRLPVKSPDPSIDRTGWPVIVAFGDSLTAGLNVPGEQNYPSQLQAELDEKGYRYRVVNAGISGDLSVGGLNRVDAVLEHKPQIVILELGANDGLQGKSVAEMKANLTAIVQRLKEAEVTVLLAGMMVPPNFGPEYAQTYQQTFTDLAAEAQVPFIPFFLEGVAGLPDLNLADGIHPTAEGYAIVVQTVMANLEPLLQK